jgi:hypothetical protein
MTDKQTVQANHEQVDEAGAEIDAQQETSDDRTALVSEARRYRKRAQAAEAAVEEVLKDLETKEAQLEEQRVALDDLQRRQAIDDLLGDEQAVDVETARVLTERVCAEMDEPDLSAAVAEVRRRKPFLFRTRALESGVLAPQSGDLVDAHETLDEAAEQAQQTGRRQDLLRYLRLRRRA